VIFSIIIPAYNVEEFLVDCLKSIQEQSFSDYEVLVVDDGSTDGTGRIAQEFAGRDKRFSVLTKKNGGVSSARNLGLEHASGEFVWFIDGDDYIHPESLSWLNRLFEQYPQADYVTFDYDWTKKRYDGLFPSIESLCQSPPQYFDCTTQEGFEDALRFSPIAACCVCYRWRLANRCRFKNLCIAEDRLFALEMCFIASAVVHTRAKIYCYYQRTGSATRKITRGFMTDLFEFSEQLFTFRERKNGWGSNYLRFVFCVHIFPGIMKNLIKLEKKSDRMWAFEKLLQLMVKVQSSFPQKSGYQYIDRIIRRKGFFLAWLLLVVRYQPRHFLARHPYLLRLYVSTKAILVPE
jgi:glycosyltransferase involved in cell wall biosynthesis